MNEVEENPLRPIWID